MLTIYISLLELNIILSREAEFLSRNIPKGNRKISVHLECEKSKRGWKMDGFEERGRIWCKAGVILLLAADLFAGKGN